MKKNSFFLWEWKIPGLQRLLRTMKLTIFLILLSVISVFAQQLNISGKVTGADNQPLPGVTIIVNGTTNGTTTDTDGKYSLSNVPNNAILRVSFVGMITQEINVQGRTNIDVVMAEENIGLEEVVAIGYGTQKKETLTGAVSSIGSDELLETKSTTLASSIQGKLAGVQIRQQTSEPGVFDSRISIRGFGDPLLVIDGVVRDNMSDFERLNPEDIESVSILKDAAASIYGMNAANGVFIVTTKQGKVGKTQFSLSSMYTAATPTVFEHQSLADAYTLKYMNNEMSRNSNLSLPISDSELAKWKAGTEPGYTDYDWMKNLMNKWVTSNTTTFNASGGNEGIRFFSSFGFNDDQGYFKINENEQYKKYTFRTNVDAKIAKGLSTRLSFYGRYENQVQPTQGVFWIYKRTMMNDRGYGAYTLANDGHLSRVPAENTNPIAELTRDISGYDQHLDFQYQSSINVTYDAPFLKGLQLNVLASYDGSLGDRRQLSKPFQLYDYKTDAPVGSPGLVTFTNTITTMTRKNIQSRITYKTTVARDHNITATLVNEVRKIDNNRLTGKRQYDDLYTTDILDQASLTNQSTGGSRSYQAYVSYLGRFNYDYKNKYLLEFSFREDGSYRYAPAKRWAFFPAASAGWRVDQEPFIADNIPIISNLKLRGSWGQSGYDAGNAFEYVEGYTFTNISGGYVFNDNVLTLGMVPPGIVNSNLSWVHTTTTDVGFDLELWRGKFGLTADYFERLEEGLLATRVSTVPNTFGASFPQENLNSQKTKGIELSASHKNNIGKFSYGVNANVTLSRLFYLHREQSPYRSTWAEWYSNSDGNGRITGRLFNYKRDGIMTSVTDAETAPLIGGTLGNSLRLPGMDNIVDVNGDGVINGSDRLPYMYANSGFFGTALNPPLQFGLNLYARYENFDFSMGLAGAGMYTMGKSRYDQWGYGTRYPMFWSKYLDRWHTEDPTANPFDPATVWIPGEWEALTANDSNNGTGLTTDKWQMNATFLRAKNVELGYTLPANATRKIGFTSVRAFVNCFNLFTLVNKNLKDVDPERAEGAYRTSNTYPLMRTFNFGLEVKF